jgi:chemotaxis protein histidine kinase CheA
MNLLNDSDNDLSSTDVIIVDIEEATNSSNFAAISLLTSRSSALTAKFAAAKVSLLQFKSSEELECTGIKIDISNVGSKAAKDSCSELLDILNAIQFNQSRLDQEQSRIQLKLSQLVSAKTDADKVAADKLAADAKAAADKAAADKIAADKVASELEAARLKLEAEKEAADRVEAAAKAAKIIAEANAAAARVSATPKASIRASSSPTTKASAKATPTPTSSAKYSPKPTVTPTPTKPSTIKITITCTKGALTKKITATKPVCPAGYKKK